ncbi:MAG TPA: response regulator, partial [Bdellovibrionales bacterium]|nr:response regulator [Bdellovibrionales bacterium]
MFDAKTKILIVDDMSTMRRLVKKACVGLGFSNIEEAEDGQKAWEKLQAAGDFQLIISDWNMPNCTGLEFLKKVRADSKFKKMPFVLLTAEAEASQMAEAIQLGVSNYIVKPLTP